MKLSRLIFIVSLIPLLAALGVQAQVGAGSARHFEKNGLEFDYPAAWQLAEGRGEDSEYAELATAGKSVQLIINWQFGAFMDCESENIRIRLTQEFVERVANQIHTTAPSAKLWQATRLAKMTADQIQLRGEMNHTPVMADIYSVVVKNYFLNLVYIRSATDASSSSAWEAVRNSLKISQGGPVAKETTAKSDTVLNGRAIRLPQPAYPAGARMAHVSGTVVIQVLINETGGVIAACVMSGPSLLQQAALDAARAAQFTSTKVSGKPVKVTGVIVYNFRPTF